MFNSYQVGRHWNHKETVLISFGTPLERAGQYAQDDLSTNQGKSKLDHTLKCHKIVSIYAALQPYSLITQQSHLTSRQQRTGRKRF